MQRVGASMGWREYWRKNCPWDWANRWWWRTVPATTFLQGGRVKALAVTSGERLKEHPTIPTLTELGVDVKVSLWFGLLAPAGTPAPIVKRLNEEVVRVMAMPELQKRLSGMSILPLTSTPEEFAKLIAVEIPLWKKVAQDNNIKPN